MKPNKIAVTGGIGSGKTAFCDIVRGMGFPVFSCDEINRELWSDEAYTAQLAAAFPACTTAGAIDKRKLSQLVFSDEAARNKLDAIAHPAIMQRLLIHMNACPGASFAEVPLLFEGGYEKMFDAVIALRRSREARLRAVHERDGLTAEQTLSRMRSQFDPARLEEKNCLILENTGSRDDLAREAQRALELLHVTK